MSCQERKVRFSRHSQESSGAGINEVGDAGESCIQFQVLCEKGVRQMDSQVGENQKRRLRMST